MVARITKIILLVQIAAIVAISFAAIRFIHIESLFLAFLLGVGSVCLLRLLINANNFFLAWLYRSEIPFAYRLNGWAACKMFCEEFTSSMLTSSWHMPFHAFSEKSAAAPTSLPVLLIHGYGCNSGYWHDMSIALSSAGIPHRAINLEPVFSSIDSFVPAVHAAVETLRSTSRQNQVIILAHSMGGLVARAYLCRHGNSAIAKVITLGTPHYGTGLAHFGPGENSRQMRWLGTAAKGQPNDWLRQLAAKEDVKNYALFVSIYSYHDNIIAPQTSSCLPGARNIPCYGIGHVALGFNRAIQKLTVQEILNTPLVTSILHPSSSDLQQKEASLAKMPVVAGKP